MDSPTELRIYAFGSPRIFRGEQEITAWKLAKAKELFFYLLYRTPRPSSTSQPTKLPIGLTAQDIGLQLWPDATAEQLQNNLRQAIFNLRRVLDDATWLLHDDIHKLYTLNRVLPHWYDVDAFKEHLAQAQRLRRQQPTQAIQQLEAAGQLYQSDFLAAEIDGEWYLDEQLMLQTSYLEALSQLGQLYFGERRYAEAIEAYRKVITIDVYYEKAHRGLMHSLAQQGEREQALRHYRLLVDKLKEKRMGPPTSETTALYERLRKGETPAQAVPFLAKQTTAYFVGREHELAHLCRVLLQPAQGTVHCLVGMGGIGKTTLALQVAHTLRHEFPDGVLWANLAASEPMSILDSWARAYECDYGGLNDLDSRATAMRDLLARKKALLILDDVWSAERARPLLLGGAQCMMLLTTRIETVAIALDAHSLPIGELTRVASQELLARIIGAARIAHEMQSTEAICQLLGDLPLALEIAAKRLLTNRRWSLSDMLTRLQQQAQRLDELKIEDKAVRASFAVSWEHLEENLRHIFAQLGVFEGRAFTAAALAASAALAPLAASDGLDVLVSLSLLAPEGEVHYRQHPLLADFAREQLGQHSEAEERMAQYYRDFASEHRHDYAAIEQERGNLLAGLATAYRLKKGQQVIDYGDALTPALFALGLYHDARQMYPLVCETAMTEEDQDAYIAARYQWARACIDQGAYTEARRHILHGLRTSREISDQHWLERGRYYLGTLNYHQNRFRFATVLFEGCIRTKQKSGEQRGMAEGLYWQSRILGYAERFAEAEQLAQQALTIQQQLDDKSDLISTLQHLARLCYLPYMLGLAKSADLSKAEQYCLQAMQLAEQLHNKLEQATCLNYLSVIYSLKGQWLVARDYASRYLESSRRFGNRKAIAQMLLQLGRIELALDNKRAALEASLQSLQYCRELRDRMGLIQVLTHLGDVYKSLDHLQPAREAWEEALLYTQQLNSQSLRVSLETRLATLQPNAS